MLSKRRVFLCRLGFILLCVVPTLIVATGIVIPNRRQPWQDRISRHLGFLATIGGVEHPRPKTTVLKDVEISDAEFGPVLRLHALEVQETSQALKLRLVHPEVRVDRLDQVHGAIQRHLIRRDLLDRSIEVIGSQIILASPATRHDSRPPMATLSNFSCRIASTATGSKLDVRFSLPGTEQAPPCQIYVERERTEQEGSTAKWMMNTHDSYVSCEMFSPLFPSLARLGADCHFRGSIEGIWDGDSWNGSMSGEFANVDLYCLIQEQFPHTFDGLANVSITSLTIQNNQIIRAVGRLRSERGTVGNSLIEAAAEQLGCRLENELKGVATRYRVIDISFDVSTAGVRILGNCKAQPATMIEGQYGEPRLRQPKSLPPLAALARMLVPQSDVQVPLTRETSKLISLFPIPSLNLHQESGTPRAVLRLE